MDAISYSYADKAQKRIKKFINEPDSTSGIVTVPKVIASGETITIPAGRVAVLPNTRIDGVLNVENGGEVFIPSGASLSKVVEKVTSTDNAIVRFDGTTGAVQNSGVIIDDNGNVSIGYSYGTSKLNISGTTAGDNIAYATGVGTLTLNEMLITTLNQAGGIEFKNSVFENGYGSKITSTNDGQMLIGLRNNSATFFEAIRIKNDGAVLFNQPTGFGYGAGSGGTVTQLTNKATAVTLNKSSGQIIMANTALAQNVKVSFLFYNSLIANTDNIILSVNSGSTVLAKYEARGRCVNSVAEIVVSHTYNSSLSDGIILNFTIIKGANS